MVGCILVGNVQHLLQARPGGTEEKQVICVSMDASVIVADHAPTTRALEDVEKAVHIKTEENW